MPRQFVSAIPSVRTRRLGRRGVVVNSMAVHRSHFDTRNIATSLVLQVCMKDNAVGSPNARMKVVSAPIQPLDNP